MQQFTIRYFDPVISSVVEEQANSESEAALRIQWATPGRVILSVQALTVSRRINATGSSRFEVAWWCRELSTLLKAGMTVVEAIETLDAQSRGSSREAVHSKLLKLLREGQALSRAMRGTGAFPDVLVASVKASERTSTLSGALEDYLRYDEMLEGLRRKAVSAAIYPAVVVTFGALIALFLLLYVIPRFSRMYMDFHGAVSVPTQVLLLISRTLHDRLPVVVAGLVVLGALAGWAWRSGFVLTAALSLIDGIGPLQRQWEHFRRAKLYQSLALMFRGGYTLDEALSVCEDMGLGRQTGQGILHAREELARGKPVAAAFESAGLTDVVSQRLLAVGERSGGFDVVLQTIADRHASSFATFVERSTRIIEPLLLLLVALVVGGIVVMMYMPIFDIANGVR